MTKHHVRWLGCLLSFAFLMIACARTGTELTQQQVDDAYKGKPVSDIMVIAITGNEHKRRSFENKFVAHLKSAGVDAVSSEAAIPMPPDLVLKKETILEAVNQYENDAVIITHLTGKDVEDVYTRGGAGSTRLGFYGFYRSRYGDPGYSSTSTTVRLETKLYDVETEQLIWSGRTTSLSKDSNDSTINDVIRTVVKELKGNKLISPK